MATKHVYDVVAVTGEYKNSEGETKKRFTKCGVVLENDKGLSMKMESVPVGKDWDGWLKFMEPKAKDGARPAARSAPARQVDDSDPF